MSRSLAVLGAASTWMIIGRASGLVWTMLLIATVGIGDYGMYAAAYALAAILSAPIENIFVVRCVRIPEDRFRGERSLRAAIGLALLVVGAALYTFAFVIGFALLVAGAEMIFNAYKSVALREGRPSWIMRADAVRQVSSIALAAGYLLLPWGGEPTLAGACLWYLAPYTVVVVLAARMCGRDRPAGIGPWRSHLVLIIDALVLSVYLQGDILLLGWIAGDEVVGVYSFASQLALAASTIGQLYGQQFTATLREAKGHHSAGAPLHVTLGIGVVLTIGCIAAAFMLLALPAYHQIGIVLMVIAPFAGLRAITNTWVTALYVRGVDIPRIGWSALALVIRFGLLGVLAVVDVPAAIAAAIAAVVGEIILMCAFRALVHGGRREQSDAAR